MKVTAKMRGGTFLRLLFFFSLMAILAGGLLPFLLDELTKIDEYKAQKRAEAIVEQAAHWYVINNGPPLKDMKTKDVQEALIPYYLNHWPGKQPIECEIDTQGNISVYTPGNQTESWLLKLFKTWSREATHALALFFEKYCIIINYDVYLKHPKGKK